MKLLNFEELRRNLKKGPYYGMNYVELKKELSDVINAGYDMLLTLPEELQQHVIGSGMDDHGAYFTIDENAPSKDFKILKKALMDVSPKIYIRSGEIPKMSKK